jgi:hypothetical protein
MERRGHSARSLRRIAHPGTGTWWLSPILLLCLRACAQVSIPSLTPPAVQPAVLNDALERAAPRDAVLGFVNVARKGDNELAASCLTTRLRGEDPEDLAHRLFVDRHSSARLNALGNQSEDSRSDPLKSERELADTITKENRNVDVILERVDHENAGSFWMSSKTFESIPDLYDETNVVLVENVLPKFLVNCFVAMALSEWLAVFAGMALFYLLTVLLNRAISSLIGQWRRRLHRKPCLSAPQVLPRPIRILLLAIVARWLLTRLSLPLLARQFWVTSASILTVAGFVWLLILLNSRGEQYIRRVLRGRNRTSATSILRLARRAIDGLIVLAGALATLYYFGVNPTAGLAAFSVGCIAVALAAQKTLLAMVRPLSKDELMAVLEEMNTIHIANMRYWKRKPHTREQDVEYERRKERLRQIRKECGWTEPGPL